MTTIKQLVALALNLPPKGIQDSIVVNNKSPQADGDITNEPVKPKAAESEKHVDVDLSTLRRDLISDDSKIQQKGLLWLRTNLVNMKQNTRGKVVNLLLQSFNSKQCKVQSDIIGVLNEMLPKVASPVRAEALSNLANALGAPISDPPTQAKTMELIQRNFSSSQSDITVRFFNGLVVQDLVRAIGDPKVSPSVVDSSIDFVALHMEKFCSKDERKVAIDKCFCSLVHCREMVLHRMLLTER